jgi:hypothetical protein
VTNKTVFSTRFSELIGQLAVVEKTKTHKSSQYSSGDYVDAGLFLNWKVKARNLIAMACGENSEHYKQFLVSDDPKNHRTNYLKLLDLKAVFLAAQEDYDGGYFNSVRNLVQAELFENELEQAEELCAKGYLSAAAVVAGVVLETKLRRLCSDNNITVGKLDTMNSALTKAEVYTLSVQKRITALADLRNNAAHGHPENFKKDDVSDMITYVQRFICDYT